MSLRAKTSVVFSMAVVAVALLGAAAFACTNLATMNLSSAAGTAGDSVMLTGSSFSVPREGPPTPVVVHWNGVDGPVLATVLPDEAGNISAEFTIPEGQPGYYVVVATQRDAEGVDAYGTPARASFQILGPGGESVVQQPGSQAPATVAGEPSSTGIIALTAGLGALGLALFGAGFVAFVRQARGREVPATVKTRRQ
ncbi:MAG TPA: hypothetical protein VG452_05700 [Egibacteraceae bacterium]|nr:hypothetical protein [Egibacteraceae bacterium]